ncbi:MAG: hypothetical protein Q9169_003234 [Polycauliona sp. 2 TL-2023]
MEFDITVSECPDGGFCCGEKNGTCCGTPEAQYIVNGQVTNINPNPTTSSSSSTSSTPGPSSRPGTANGQSVRPIAESSGSGGTPVGAIAGGVIGGVVALALLGAAIWWFRGRRKQKAPVEMQQHQAPDGYYPPAKSPAPPGYHDQPGLHEVHGGPNGLDTAQLDSRETYEIGYQAKDRMARHELA